MPDDAAAIRAAARRAVRRGRRQQPRAGHRRQPELVHADPGHRRRLPADPELADRSTARSSRRRTSPAPRRWRCSARSSRTAVRRGRRSDRPDHPHPQPAVQGHRRDGAARGTGAMGQGPGRRDLRAVHDGAEEAAGHHSTSTTSRCRRHDGRDRPGRRSDRACCCALRHKIIGNDPDDFMVRTLEEMASVRTEATKTMTTLLASIAGVSLHRRRHRHHEHHAGVGHRADARDRPAHGDRRAGQGRAAAVPGRGGRAQPARRPIGIGMGYALSGAAEKFLSWPTSIPPEAIAMAFGFAAMTGVFFGFYPARKASRLDPIEALRFE